VAAVSASNVWAVGSQPVTSGIGRSGLAMHYNGTSWTASALPAPNVPVNGEWELSAISADAADVRATGFVSNADGLVEHAIVEHFNGTRWSLTQAPDLGPNYPINTFNAVLAISRAAYGRSASPPPATRPCPSLPSSSTSTGQAGRFSRPPPTGRTTC